MVWGGNPPISPCLVKPLDHKFISVPQYHWLLGVCKINGGYPWAGS